MSLNWLYQKSNYSSLSNKFICSCNGMFRVRQSWAGQRITSGRLSFVYLLASISGKRFLSSYSNWGYYALGERKQYCTKKMEAPESKKRKGCPAPFGKGRCLVVSARASFSRVLPRGHPSPQCKQKVFLKSPWIVSCDGIRILVMRNKWR